MRKVKIADNLEVSAVGLGCMGLHHAFGPITENSKAIEFIKQAYQVGYTFFDTAECYVGDDEFGNLIYNESILGAALKDIRKEVVIATKFGVKWENGATGAMLLDSSPKTIRKSVEGSLERLQTNYIDLYYQHRQDPNTPVEEVASVMKELIEEGKIKHWGLSACDVDTIRRAHAICPVTAVESEYSMQYRKNESDVIPVCEELGIAFIPYSPLAKGFLTATIEKGATFPEGDTRNHMRRFEDSAMDANHQLLEFVVKIAKEKNCTPAQISLAWVMARNPKTVPIPGTRKVERLLENAGAADIVLSQEEYHNINELLKQIDYMEVNYI